MQKETKTETETKTISTDQKKIIWAIWKTKVKLDNDDLYLLILQLFKKDKMGDLTFQEADLLISSLRRQTGEETAGKLTRKQRFTIIGHQEQLGWSDSELAGFVKKQTGVEHYDWLSVREASTVITGLINYRRWLRKKRG